MNVLKKLSQAGLVVLFPIVTFANSYYYPVDVEHVFLDEKSDNRYEVLVELESGKLFRMGRVSFDSSRYNLFESVADEINDHRNFRGFDDEDVEELVWGIAPFTFDEVAGIATDFSEEELIVILEFQTGDEARVYADITQRFSSSAEVTEFVTEIINGMEEFDGEIDVSTVDSLHTAEYTGLSYFAPFLEQVIVNYNYDELNFDVSVDLGEEESREFILDYQDTKEALLETITSTINESYIEYEDAYFSVFEVDQKLEWIGVPWMIDDIESIIFSPEVSQDGTITFTIRARLSDGLVGVVDLNKVYNLSTNNLDQIAAAATEVLEENELFVHAYNRDLVYEVLLASLDEDQLENFGLAEPAPVENSVQEETTEQEPTAEEVQGQLVAFLYEMLGIDLPEEDSDETENDSLEESTQEDAMVDNDPDDETLQNVSTSSQEILESDPVTVDSMIDTDSVQAPATYDPTADSNADNQSVDQQDQTDQSDQSLDNTQTEQNTNTEPTESTDSAETATAGLSEEEILDLLIALIIAAGLEQGADLDPALFE